MILKAGHEYVMVSSGEGAFDPQVLSPKNASLAPELLYLCCRETQANGPAWELPGQKREATSFSPPGNFKFKPVTGGLAGDTDGGQGVAASASPAM